MRFIARTHGYLLTSFDQEWLRPNKLQEYARRVHEKSDALRNCWGFVDGTVRAICRPEKNQRVVYNGHKRVHALKYQSVVAANGLIANLYGPIGNSFIYQISYIYIYIYIYLPGIINQWKLIIRHIIVQLIGVDIIYCRLFLSRNLLHEWYPQLVGNCGLSFFSTAILFPQPLLVHVIPLIFIIIN